MTRLHEIGCRGAAAACGGVRVRRALWPLAALTSLCAALSPYSIASEPAPGRRIASDREWDVLSSAARGVDQRAALLQAGLELGDWKIHLAGTELDGPRLQAISRMAPQEPLVRVIREALRRPVDLDDFLLFMDDVLREGRAGLRGEVVWLTPGRARKAGILVHSDDVFERGRPRLYGSAGALSIDRPRPQVELPPAEDGEPLGPRWTVRFRNPEGERELLSALARHPGSRSFAERVESLLRQLREQGAEVYLNSTVRARERGYLMWGAFELSRAQSEGEVAERVAKLRSANSQWRLFVPIQWLHPDGWRATREAAREMADSYEVVYASEQGARASSHYTGEAVDLVAVGLPRGVGLRGVDGAERRFDLSAPGQTRDLSLTPELIDWVERHFGLRKLVSDYPHWSDTAR